MWIQVWINRRYRGKGTHGYGRDKYRRRYNCSHGKEKSIKRRGSGRKAERMRKVE